MAFKMDKSRVCLQKRKVATPVLLLAGELLEKAPRRSNNRQVPHYLFHYIISGSGNVSVEAGPVIQVSAGDWFFAFPNQTIRYAQNENDQWLYKWIGFQGDDIEYLLGRAGIYADTAVRKAEFDSRFADQITEMIETLDGNSVAADLEANKGLMQLMIYLIKTAPANKSPQRIPRDKFQAVIDRALIFMGEYFPSGIGAAEVARHAGFERSYFSKMFSEYAGITIKDYLASLRIRKAKELLMEPKCSISAIAQAVGFTESRTFSRFFKDQTNLSPSQWRKKMTD